MTTTKESFKKISTVNSPKYEGVLGGEGVRGPSAISFFRGPELLMIVVEFRMIFRINSSQSCPSFFEREGGQNILRNVFVFRTLGIFETISEPEYSVKNCRTEKLTS